MLRPTMLLWLLPLALTLGCGGVGSNAGDAGNEPADELAGIIVEIEDPGPVRMRVRAPVFEGDDVWNAHHASRLAYLHLVRDAREQAISELGERWSGTELPGGRIRCPRGPEELACGCLAVFRAEMNGLWVQLNAALFLESQRRRAGSWSASDVRGLNFEGTRVSVAAFWAAREDWELDAGRRFVPRLCGWEGPARVHDKKVGDFAVGGIGRALIDRLLG